MDLNTLTARLTASRQVEAKVAGATFKLELPSEHTWRTTYEAHRDARGRLLEARASRVLLEQALVAWEGVTAQHILPDAPAEALDFSSAARATLLDVRQDIADELIVKLGDKLREVREAREAARKNS